jgi:uncharacterized membrane protein
MKTENIVLLKTIDKVCQIQSERCEFNWKFSSNYREFKVTNKVNKKKKVAIETNTTVFPLAVSLVTHKHNSQEYILTFNKKLILCLGNIIFYSDN